MSSSAGKTYIPGIFVVCDSGTPSREREDLIHSKNFL
ncbi:hypothetical protein SLEP1_g19086 [Rubroshorea leprosula]|nr:hypothetical protein SLEP1_g19086 [Rubroshorea leprosula]